MFDINVPTHHINAHDAGYAAGRRDRQQGRNCVDLALEGWFHANGEASCRPFSDSFRSGYKAGNNK
jgi:hypothetical protein